MKSDPKLVDRVRARRLNILNQGVLFNGISPDVDPEKPPEWFDPVSYGHAQKLFETYKVIIGISQFYGLILVMYHSSGLIPLLTTENSSTISKLFTRYFSTIIHISNWFEDDPFDNQSKAFCSLRMVRGMHKKVAEKMNLESSFEQDGKTVLWINQYDMCHTQFSFVAFMALFPKELGFHRFTDKDFHAMFHFWRVIGYCLGIDDRFNICSGNDQETFELCRQIYFDQWLPVISEAKEKTGIEMNKGVCTALSRVNPFINYNALMHYASSFMQLDSSKFPLQNIVEKILYYNYIFIFRVATKFQIANWLFTKFQNFLISRAIKHKRFHEEDLKKKFSIIFENNRCPFDAKFNHVDASNLV